MSLKKVAVAANFFYGNLNKSSTLQFKVFAIFSASTPNDTILELFIPKPNGHIRFKGTPL